MLENSWSKITMNGDSEYFGIRMQDTKYFCNPNSYNIGDWIFERVFWSYLDYLPHVYV